MNKKFTQQMRELYSWLNNHIVIIIGLAVVFWIYYLYKILGLAVLASVIFAGWGISKMILGKTEKSYNKSPENIDTKLIREKISSSLVNDFKRQGRLRVLKIVFVIMTYTFIILFFVGILLYNNELIAEKNLQLIGIITAVIYLGLHALGIEKDEAVKAILHNLGKCPFLQKPKAIFGHYLSFINFLNIYLFPFIAWIALVITISAGMALIPATQIQSILLLYVISLSLLIINSYTFRERKGFLKWLSKFGGVFKTLTYIFIPVYIIGMLLLSKPLITVSDYVMSLLLGMGSLWLIYKDPLYWRVNVPTMRRSGGAFFGSYFQNLFRYGLIFLVAFGAYYSSIYFRDHNSHDLFKPDPIFVFADLQEDHWAYKAIAHLYENGLIIPDASNFIHPALELDAPSALSMIFDYFDIQAEDFESEPSVNFAYISEDSESYPVFKIAHHFELVGTYIDPEQVATREFALTTLGRIEYWFPYGTPADYPAYAYEKGIISSIDPISLAQPLNRASLAQMLYKLYLSKQTETK